MGSILDGGFGDEEAAEAVVHELDAHQTFAGFAVADVDDAALGGEVVAFMFAACSELRERDTYVEVHADGYVEASAKGSAAAAKVLTRCGFFEGDATGVATAHGDGKADCNATLGAGPCGG